MTKPATTAAPTTATTTATTTAAAEVRWGEAVFAAAARGSWPAHGARGRRGWPATAHGCHCHGGHAVCAGDAWQRRATHGTCLCSRRALQLCAQDGNLALHQACAGVYRVACRRICVGAHGSRLSSRRRCSAPTTPRSGW